MSNRFSYANGTNAQFIDQMYEEWKQDPTSVESSWKQFFEGYELAMSMGAGQGEGDAQDTLDHSKVEALINAFRRIGHLSAHVNPLVPKPKLEPDLQNEIDKLSYIDDNRVFHPTNLGDQDMPFGVIKEKLIDTYTDKIGADFREINDVQTLMWLQNKMEEVNNKPTLDKVVKGRILKKLSEAEGFERFLQARYLGQKRFSLEGLESLIPMLDMIIEKGASLSVEEICIGMAHRGRLNVLTNIMGKQYSKMLLEFEGSEFNPHDIDGDVKYHMGYSKSVSTQSGQSVRLLLSPNPSHLEAVNPVVEGFVHARQKDLGDIHRKKVMPILLHGDASFIGQGVVAETLNLGSLEAYETGGTMHIITNNQIGFTTNPSDSRSCSYASDIAKVVRAPVLHVNADDPEACIWAAMLAAEYRQIFSQDIVIDLIGYRRYGHNEGDEPSYTQPELYRIIKKHPTVLKIYSDKLQADKAFTGEETKAPATTVKEHLQQAFEDVRADRISEQEIPYPDALKFIGDYRKVERDEIMAPVKTAITKKLLTTVGKAINSYPTDFKPHPKIDRLLAQRRQMFDKDGSVDWGFAELLALGTLAEEGHHVRLSGQDCKRGTFSHRHGIIFDYEKGHPCELLNQISDNQENVHIINSPLSEQACLGFEFGYSVAKPDSLTCWEAQFGDFANGGQIIIDQFISASEAKWNQTSNLTLLLPHGHEGMGPEHSSGRPERFLQLCGNFNMQVANVTTPAQYFHILRRQAKREFRKPLVIMTPKSLLRHPLVKSKTEEFTKGSFQEILEDDVKNKSKASRIVACTGKIYYDLLAFKEQDSKYRDVPLIRLEQLYPFPAEKLVSSTLHYKNAKEIIWVQEEPMNMGAWNHVRSRIEELVEGQMEVKYVGRKYSGTTSEGSSKAHQIEQQRIVEDAFMK